MNLDGTINGHKYGRLSFSLMAAHGGIHISCDLQTIP